MALMRSEPIRRATVAAVWGATCGLAYLDELHQKRSGGRCFRRVDLLHGVLGASLMMLFIFLREFF